MNLRLHDMGRSLDVLNRFCQAQLNHITLVALYHDEMNFGERFRKLRNHLKLSGDQMGEICGVTKGGVSQWESNKTAPELDRLIALADKHPISLDWLLTGRGEMMLTGAVSEPARHIMTRLSTMTEREQYRIVRMVDAFADDAAPNDCDEPGHCGERTVDS